ncbi:unnamed protein product [Diplocarpon coronariae]
MSSHLTPTFTMFPCLPQEVQLLIWDSLIAQSPQTLLITQTDGFWATSNKLPIFTPNGSISGASSFVYADGTERFSVKSSGDVPAVLSTSVSSRALALGQYYRILLDTADHPRYFNFSTDTLAIRCHPQWGSSSPYSDPCLQASLARVKNLVVLGFRWRGYAFSCLSLTPFLGLEKLTLFRRRGGREGGRIERRSREAVEKFWGEKMNPRQEACRLKTTLPPAMIFWTLPELEAFEKGLGGFEAPKQGDC